MSEPPNSMEPEARGSSISAERSRPSEDQRLQTPSRERTDGPRRPSGTTKTCGKCGLPLSGQFVRALDSTFHLECFTCHECGKLVASKFFPHPETGPNQYPLCETDYFRRLNLLCHACGGALRGSYITALDRKYHIEHFTCSVCPTIFGASDSYYEHEGSVYCHYHYSTRFAQKCNGCQTAILKQFVEIYRNGVNQHWHPECYMIHKYWNVRLAQPGDPLVPQRSSVDGSASEQERQRVRDDEEAIEKKVLWIWRTLSAYEEKSATCISDMLVHVSNGAYVDGTVASKKFITHVDLLFTAADDLDTLIKAGADSKGLSCAREAKLLCKKVVAFFTLLAKSQDTGVRRLGVTQDLLSLVTALAHYLKLLIRICFQGALKYERDHGTDQALEQLLNTINTLEGKLEAEEASDVRDLTDYVRNSADLCPVCKLAVDDKCFKLDELRFHYQCMKCVRCNSELHSRFDQAYWDKTSSRMFCRACVGSTEASTGFVEVSKLQHYVHLLKVAHARLLATLRTSGALPHTSDDPNLEKYDSSGGLRPRPDLNPPLLRSDSRSKSYSGAGTLTEEPSSYEQTLGDIKRLRSTRMDRQISNANRQGRTSRVIDGPNGMRPASAGNDEDTSKGGFRVMQSSSAAEGAMSKMATQNEGIRLDDIPRLVAAEQAKEQRPNASKYAREGLGQSEPQPKLLSAHRRDTSGTQELEKLGPEGHRPKKYFSELTPLEYFVVKHVAVLSMEPLLEGQFNQEELLDLIESRKPTFWGKFGKAFQKNEKPKTNRKKGIFGVPLEVLVERDGEECDDGVGPGALKVPAIVQDAVSAMKTMDMSVEGVFRKNGNIRRLKEIAEAMDTRGTSDAVDLNTENAVQVAALLKKWLRELPEPVLTFKLHKLFVTASKIQDEDKQRRILHLTCCLLPKAHRDTMEVLFTFLNWVASFSTVDEETGSKMDVHNLATVIAPNILFSNTKTEGAEDSFLGIEAVNQLIRYNESMSQVPDDFQSILNDTSMFSGSAEITTKEVLKRYAEYSGRPLQHVSSYPNGSTDAASKGTAQTPAPVVGNAESTLQHAGAKPWSAEPSFRPAAKPHSPGPAHPQPPPPQLPGAAANGFYANSQHGSRDSIGANGAPARYHAATYQRETHTASPGPNGAHEFR